MATKVVLVNLIVIHLGLTSDLDYLMINRVHECQFNNLKKKIFNNIKFLGFNSDVNPLKLK